LQDVKSEAQHVAVIALDKELKGLAVPCLRPFDQSPLIRAGQGSPGFSNRGGLFPAISPGVARPCDCHSVG
jgi:hypothetical protein